MYASTLHKRERMNMTVQTAQIVKKLHWRRMGRIYFN